MEHLVTMEIYGAAPHDDVLALLIQVGVLLLCARALGELARLLGQPRVVGEIGAGVLLGPSLLGWALPSVAAWVAPQNTTQGHLLEIVALLGATALLLVTGLETDLGLIRRQWRTALGVSIGGVTVTFLSGFALGQVLPDELLGDPSRRLLFSLFLATAMAISAIPVLARVLMELDLMRRNVGQAMLAAGMSDDTIGWILLSVIIALSSGEVMSAASVGGAIATVVLFLVLSVLVGRFALRPLFRWVSRGAGSEARSLSLVFGLAVVWAALTQGLGLEAVFGSFVMGVLLAQHARMSPHVVERLESFSNLLLAPVFFAVAGLKVDLPALLEPRLLLIGLAVIAVATGGKVVGTYVGARLFGRQDHWTALAFGAGLNARGALEIIIATIGLSLGLLSQDLFSVIVVMAITTSLMAPPALRWVLLHVTPAAEEVERLRREELAAASPFAGLRRVLIPVRWRPGLGNAAQRLEADLLARLGRERALAATIFCVEEEPASTRTREDLLALGRRLPLDEVVVRVVPATRPADAILDEAHKGYDLIVLGATEAPPSADPAPPRTGVFNAVVDQVVRMAPCATMVVHAPTLDAGWRPRRILVPTNGSRAARAAAELAFTLADPGSVEIVVLNVVSTAVERASTLAGNDRLAEVVRTRYELVDELCELGASRGIQVQPLVEVGGEPDDVVLKVASELDIDLIVLGTEVRAGSRVLFLGPRVERIVVGAQRPVVVLNIE